MSTVFNKKLLSLAVCSAAIASAQPAMAQEEPAMLEEIVVRGMRSSIQNAQDIKRDGDTVKDVITASDIGALPDRSVTEALQRVPGVTIERFASSDDPNHYADEGTGVLVRGLDRVRSEINGRDSFSANPFGGLNFEDIPPELLGSVEVVKNQTADMIAGGIAGTVNLVTRKPFDSDGRVLGGTVKANYGDFREHWTPSVSGLFSDVWETEAGYFGFQISASMSEFKTRGDGVGIANYYSRGDAFGEEGSDLEGPAFDEAQSALTEDPNLWTGQEPGSVLYVPGQFSIRTAENDRERTGVSSVLQWRNHEDSIQTTLEYIRSDASLQYRENVIGPQEQGFRVGMGTDSLIRGVEGLEPTFDANGFFTSGVLGQGPNLPMQLSTRFNDTENTVEDISFNVQLRPSDRLGINLDFQRIEATETVGNFGINTRMHNPWAEAYVDVRGEFPKVEFLSSRMHAPEATWVQDQYMATAMDHYVDSDATANSFQLDVDYELDHGWARSVSAGMYYSDKDLTIRDTEYSNWGVMNTPWVAEERDAGGYQNNTNQFERQNWHDFFDGDRFDGEGLRGDAQQEFMFVSMNAAENFGNFMRQGCGNYNTAGGGQAGHTVDGAPSECFLPQTDQEGRVAPGSPFSPSHVSSTNEERFELYTRLDFEVDDFAVPFRGNVGLRYVSYQLESTGFALMPQPLTDSGEDAANLFAEQYPSLAQLADGEGDVSTVDGTDFDTFLPSLNLAFNVADDVIVRFGASRGLYFPTLDNTRNSSILRVDRDSVLETPGQDFDPDTNPVVDYQNVALTGTARNPYLEPETATNLDLTGEWYFSDTGSLTASVFYKKISDLHRERTFTADVTNPRTNVTESASLTGPANVGSGSIQGLELSYTQFFDQLPGAWSGLGVQMNYTVIDQNDLNDPGGDSANPTVQFDSSGNEIDLAGRDEFRVFTGLPLPGYSDENYNIVGMYEYENISARLAYTWRSDYLVTRRDSNEFAPIYSKASGFLDGSIYYNITDEIQIGFEASNILDTITQTQAQFNQEGVRTDALNFKTDRRYALSLRASF